MFYLSSEKINSKELRAMLKDPAAGAFVCFEGWVRNHNQGKKVLALDYEAYEKLAVTEGERIIQEALDKFDCHKAVCSHRVGSLKIGDMAIWVGVVASHRDAAFQACRHILDEVKSRIPIWKNELWDDGESGWIESN